MLHFQCCDVVQHALWPYLDTEHKLYESKIHDIIMRDFYGLIDKTMEDIHRKFQELNNGNTLTLIASDHGFEAHNKRVNLGYWLIKQGYLSRNSREKLNPLKKITKKLHVGKTLKKLFGNSRINTIEKATGFSKKPFDWDKSHAFSIGRSGEGAIYILNEYDTSKTAELIERLTSLRDPQTGEKICEKILTKQQLYGSNASNIFPDITIVPTKGYTFTGSAGSNPKLLTEVNPDNDFHLGKHHEDGIIVFSGNDIVRKNNLVINITDITPTILNFLKIPIPRLCDGKIIELNSKTNATASLYSDEHLKPNINCSSDNDIKERLRDLGYM